MSSDKQQVILAIAYHVGQLVLAGKSHDDRAFLRNITELKHELAKAEARFAPIIPDLESDAEGEDDEL
jgi:hypothetical protein